MFNYRLLPLYVAFGSAFIANAAAAADFFGGDSDKPKTRTPIKHLIVIIGENHTFDNVFGTYQPNRGHTVDNLLSKGIVNADGSPGPNFALAAQRQAQNHGAYSPVPITTTPYATLPQPATTYATGVPPGVPDARFPADLPNGPFQITKYVTYDAHTGDPVHRFFQMWQQFDAGKLDLFAWVALTVGTGPQNNPPLTPGNTFQGGEALGFYNMKSGDAAIFNQLAQRYAISDNYHQAIMGGTGANFIAVVTADAGFYNQDGVHSVPPANQIENPNAQAGTNNFYTQDGYAGGSYVNCADANQPGVAPIDFYMRSLPYRPFNQGNCAADTYYLLNNYSLGYDYHGTPRALGSDKFVLPPQTIPTIADALAQKGVSWKWYSGGRHANTAPDDEYCGICDPLTGFTSIMTSDLKNNLQGMDEFYADVQSEKTLPSVVFIRPFESKAGHPANAVVADYEKFVQDIVNRVQTNRRLWDETAILVTVDEGGGYYDSGYIQTLDFFGDGTRIPLIAISPWAKAGHIDHTYADHASIAKFIERNWGLAPLSNRSRDNLPNPLTRNDPYVPANRPAIGDLMSLFYFDEVHEHDNR
ncbi:MAG TPA: alkaline phosphatase family protein [Spongiibacteraceae bacterium]|jgi:phospholipase C